MISITIEGQEAIFAKFKEIDQRLKPKAVAMLTDAVYDDVFDAADKHTKTGALARSLKKYSVPDGYVIEHDLQHAPHARFVHWGTKPHLIKPKDKKALRWASGKGFVFAKFVNHPGYKGDPYMVEAVRKAESQHWPRILNQLKV